MALECKPVSFVDLWNQILIFSALLWWWQQGYLRQNIESQQEIFCRKTNILTSKKPNKDCYLVQVLSGKCYIIMVGGLIW